MKAIKNHYFKQGENLISGIPLKENVKRTHFIQCTFHPNIEGTVHFEDCIFENCDDPTYFLYTKNCEIITT